MTCVIQLVAFASGMSCNHAWEYLKSFDPDAFSGRGYATWTPETSKAMRFVDTAEALAMYRRQSAVQPLRPDGKPNRPLTGYTILVVPLRPR
jgi:hypothetical protein